MVDEVARVTLSVGLPFSGVVARPLRRKFQSIILNWRKHLGYSALSSATAGFDKETLQAALEAAREAPPPAAACGDDERRRRRKTDDGRRRSNDGNERR